MNIKLQTWLHTGAGAMYSKTECPIVIHIDLNGCFAPLFKSHGTYLHRRAGIRNFKSRCFLPAGSAQCAMQIECMNGSHFLAVVADDLMIIFHTHQIFKHSDGNFRLPFISPVYLIQKSFQQRNISPSLSCSSDHFVPSSFSRFSIAKMGRMSSQYCLLQGIPYHSFPKSRT